MSEPSAPVAGSLRGILRNTSYLMIAQLVAAPLSMLVLAVAARSLGPGEFGLLHQALTFAAFALLFVEWGQPNVLTGQVAMHRDRAGELLGSGILIRLAAGLAAALLLPLAASISGYSSDFVITLALALCLGICGTVAGACQDVYRGLERLDFAALTMVGWQLLLVAVALPVLLNGGGLHAFMLAQLSCAAVGTLFVLWMAPRLGVPPLASHGRTMRELLRLGNPFLVFSLVLALQPTIDATMLSKLATPEEMGWYAASRKLVGVLGFPAAAMLGALYPALCRLRGQSMEAFHRTTTNAIHAAISVAVPAALGCALFPELGVSIFGREDFAPAEENLRMLAPWLLLVYVSMPVGSCLTAAGRQRAWTIVLFAGVATTTVLEPALIRWAQQQTGNAGLGVCAAGLVGEMVTVTSATLLLPRAVLRGLEPARLVPPLVSGVAMAAVGLAAGSLSPLAGAPLALASYMVAMHLTGGLDIRQVFSFARGLRHPA